MAEALGQPVVIENRPGANATLGTDFVAKRAPDGYTITLGSLSPAGDQHGHLRQASRTTPRRTSSRSTPWRSRPR